MSETTIVCPIEGIDEKIVTERMLKVMNILDKDWGKNSYAAMVMAIAAIASRQPDPEQGLVSLMDHIKQALRGQAVS